MSTNPKTARVVLDDRLNEKAKQEKLKQDLQRRELEKERELAEKLAKQQKRIESKYHSRNDNDRQAKIPQKGKDGIWKI